jgi:hypothetical protein
LKTYIYKASAVIPYNPSLKTGEIDNYSWYRLSGTSTLSHYTNTSNQVVNRRSLGAFTWVSHHNWKMEGYVYKVYKGGKTYWLPDYVQRTGKVQMGYSVLTHSDSGNVNPYECDTISVPIDQPTVAKTRAEQNSSWVLAYPNPTRDNLQIDWSLSGDQVSIHIFDLFGREIDRITALSHRGSREIRLLNSGVYLVLVQSEKESKSIKIVVN